MPLKKPKRLTMAIALPLTGAVLIGGALALLNAPLPKPKVANEVHTWPVPRQSMIDLLKSDWFNETAKQPPQVNLTPAQISNQLLGCWRYRNSRFGNFESALIIRSVDTDKQTVSGWYNFDSGSALALKGSFKIDPAKKTVLLTLTNQDGRVTATDLLLRRLNLETPCLCAASSDRFKGHDFRAVRTSVSVRPVVCILKEEVQPAIVSQLLGKWHGKTAAAPHFDIEKFYDDGSFALAGAPLDGGFVDDEGAASLLIGPQAYSHLALNQEGATVTLCDSLDQVVFTKEQGQAPRNNENSGGSMFKGLLNLIREHNDQ